MEIFLQLCPYLFYFVILTKLMSKLKFNDFFMNKNAKVQFSSIYKITPLSAVRGKRFVNLVRGRECFVGLSTYVVY